MSETRTPYSANPAPGGVYSVLMIDPPWPVGSTVYMNRDRVGYKTRVGPTYNTTTTDVFWALFDAEIAPLLTSDATAYMWTIERFLLEAERGMSERGYKRHARFIWDKGEKGMSPCATVRTTHEYLVWFYRPPLRPVAKAAQARYTTLIRERPREHSRKPEAAYMLVAALYPDARRLDAFARERRVGWDAFGDQVDHFTPLLAGLQHEGVGE